MISTVSTSPRTAAKPYSVTMAGPAAVAEPKGGAGVMGGMGDTLQLGASLAHLYNGAKTAIDGGKALRPDATKLINSAKKLKGNGILDSMKGLATGSLAFAKRSAIFAGAISVVSNGYKLMNRQISFGQFGSNVVGDTIGGFAGGAGGAVASAIGLAALGAFGVTGTIATIGGVVAGFVGYTLAENMVRRTGLFKQITGTVRNALS